MRCPGAVLILIILVLSVNVLSAGIDPQWLVTRGYAWRGEPEETDSRREAVNPRLGADRTGSPGDHDAQSSGSNQGNPVPQTQASGGAFAVFDDYYVSVTQETFGAPGSEHHFLSSLDEPVQESWRESILSEIRSHGPDARQEYTFTTIR
ncbi:MAG: hypothetical protein HYX75_18145 [Acidobacteria bacterium]|nr:hypothetical protein [Acidobacteriota bacterium]